MRGSARPAAELTRRTVIGGGAAAALSAASYRRVLGANDRVGLAFIGFGLIGKRHVLDFKDQPDAEVVGVAEVHGGRREEGVALAGGRREGTPTSVRFSTTAAVDAVVVSTPDHWHALMTMMACAAGKDVYVEKPLSLFIREGRWMVDVARRHDRVVQVGTQQRSGPHYQKARELIRGGQIGEVVAVRMWHYRNVMPGFGSPEDSEPPPELDYDMWLGPAPKRPYNPNRALYHFRWFWDYSGGQMTNLGQHSLDIAHWILDAKAPAAVTSAGGRFALKDNGETPDVQDTLFEYPGWVATWSHRECSKGADPAIGVEFCGTQGSLKISRKGFVLSSDPEVRGQRDAAPVRSGAPGRRAGDEGRASLAAGQERDGRGSFRRRIRPVPAPCPQLSRLREDTPPADLRPGERASCRDGVPSGEPFVAAWPEAAVGCGPRSGDRRCGAPLRRSNDRIDRRGTPSATRCLERGDRCD